jgi:transposase
MARPYSVDLRARVVRAVESGASRRAAAAKFEVSISFVVKLMQRWQRCGTAHDERVRALAAAEPDLTIAELRQRLAADGIAVSRSGLGHFLIAAGLTRKKDPLRRRTGPPGCRRGEARLA